MWKREDLRKHLGRIDGKGYKAYKDIQGVYDFGEFSVFMDYVQGDPFRFPQPSEGSSSSEEGPISTRYFP